jgi:acyl transferase domain-containing protein
VPRAGRRGALESCDLAGRSIHTCNQLALMCMLLPACPHRAAVSDMPLAFAASKASAGHAEPAAGAVALAAAVNSLQARALSSLLHVTAVNPHVAQCLDGAGKARGKAATLVPRSSAPLPLHGSGGRVAAGISAFAFQVSPWGRS